MKRSAKVMSLAMALAMTSEMAPLASAQTPPPAQQTQDQQTTQGQQTPQGQQSQAQQKQSNQQQYKHPKARGAAGGAIIGGAMGNAGAGAEAIRRPTVGSDWRALRWWTVV